MQKQDSTHRQKGQHLTSLERRKVAGFRQAGKSNRWIAAEIGVCPQTINNEIKRGTVVAGELALTFRQIHDNFVINLHRSLILFGSNRNWST